jgi:membrane protein
VLQKLFKVIYCLYNALIDTIHNDGIEHAGYLAFLILLSIFPFLIVLMALASTLANLLDQYNISWLSIIDNIIIPGNSLTSLMPRIQEIISGPPQSLLTVAIVGATWTASSTIEGFRTILNKAYKVPVSPPYILRRILSVLQFLIITLIITLTTICSALIPMHTLHYLKYIIIEFILFTAVSWLHFMLPNIKQNLIEVFPGSTVTVTLWTISATVFKQYLNISFHQLNLIYGSLSGIVISLLFFYMISLIFIYGAKFNFHLKYIKYEAPRR